jgi:beta-lactamase class D
MKHSKKDSPKHLRLVAACMLALLLSTGCVGSSGTALPSTPSGTAAISEIKPEFEKYFQGFTGAFVLYDLHADRYLRYNPEQCTERFLPASTFKVVNSLIALESAIIPDENYVIHWDGTLHENSAWNQNHTLKTAFRNSVVWYYQELARRVGREKMQQSVEAVGYGNQDIAGKIDSFWLEGALRISADEQLELLKRLYGGDLPFSQRTMKIVKEILILDNAAAYRLSGKTGSGQQGTAFLGWFVGYLEDNDNVYFFATNIEGSSPEAKGVTAKEITEDILQSLDLLPQDLVHVTPTLPIELPYTYTYNDPDGTLRTVVEPPPAVLEINGANQVSAVGTFCWYGYCDDPFAALTPQEALVVTPPLSASLTLLVDKPPTSLQFRSVRVTAEFEIDYTGGAKRWWDVNQYLGKPTQLLLQKEQSFELALGRGSYVLSVLGFWESEAWEPKGDVAYGFLIEVR